MIAAALAALAVFACAQTPSDATREAGRRLALGDYEGAVSAASRALEGDPDDARALARRAEAYNGLARYDRAHADAVRALALDPRSARALQNKAWAELKRGDGARALATIGEAAALDKEDAATVLIRAYVRDQAGDRAGALADLRLAARLDSRMADAADDYAAGGKMHDPFAGRARATASVFGTLAAAGLIVVILAAGWMAGRWSRAPELMSAESLREAAEELARGPEEKKRAGALSAHPLWGRRQPPAGPSKPA